MSFDIFFIATLIGTAAFALSGFIAGVRHHMDIMGVFILSFLTANGGGIVRDVLVGKTPVILTDFYAIITVISFFIIGLILNRFNYMEFERKSVFVVSDSVGLVAFSLTGALIGLEAELSLFGVCLLSFIAAAGGGIVRDILVNEVPTIMRSDFYGTVAIVVALAVYVLNVFNYQNDLTTLGVFVVALALRLVAHRQGWHLPKLKF